MANAVLTPELERRQTWLDRPILPTWQKIGTLVVHWELIAFGLIFVLGFTLRIWDLGSRAMHHDESLHAYYAWKFFVGQGYTYDPLMHGPLQFEFVPLFYLLFGDSEFSARLLAVSLGTLMIPLPYFLRRYITVPGALIASLGLAISPTMVYFSRFIRDDIYLACFSLITFICLVRYLDRPRPSLLYIASAAMALAVASMEAAYITAFIFGTFLAVEALREWMSGRQGPVLSAVRATSLDTWLTALSIFVVITVLLYSTFFTNSYGIWDPNHPLTGPDSVGRKDILGGLTYWRAQQGVERGSQPWFYYLLTLPLYEQIAVVFGIAGMIWSAFRRTVAHTLLVWWLLLSYGLYTWAGEKMPWLTLHIALPLILLAGLFVGEVLLTRRTWIVAGVGALFALLLAVEIHSTFSLSFADAANPTEMLIYVQTSQDVPNVTAEMRRISQAKFGGLSMPIGVDSTDVGGWPFTWYLRDFTAVSQSSTFSGPVCGGKLCGAMVLLQSEFDANSKYLMKNYVATKYRWNWWFPEDYKDWFPAHWNALLDDLSGKGTPGESALPTSSEWHSLWNWFVYRTPFGERGARWMYFLVRRDLIPKATYYSTSAPGGNVTTPPVISAPSVSSSLLASFGNTGTTAAQLSGPRDLTTLGNNIYVADTLNHRVVEYTAAGRLVRQWGSAGTAPGQFSQRDSPLGIAAGPDGLIYVADTWNQRIQVFTAEGKFVRQWGGGAIGQGPNQFYGPRSIAVSPSGKVYVADTGNERIQVFDARGRFLYSFGSRGSGPDQLNEPSSVAIGPDGTVYVADFWNQRIQVFDAKGVHLRFWSVPDWTSGSYDEPYIAVSGTTLYAADPGHASVLQYTTGGNLLGEVTGPPTATTSGAGPAFTLPIGVAVTSTGHLAVADPTAGKIVLLSIHRPTPHKAASATHRPRASHPTKRKP